MSGRRSWEEAEGAEEDDVDEDGGDDGVVCDAEEEDSEEEDEHLRVALPSSGGAKLEYEWRTWRSPLTQEGLEEHLPCVADAVASFSQRSYWLGASDEPVGRCERWAAAVFSAHTRGVEFDPRTSGVEWWTQIRTGNEPPSRDIGCHWDKDEQLCDDEGLQVCPHLATVTYLSSHGAPTLVLERPAPLEHEATAAEAYGPFPRVLVSHPRRGKHICFDGRLLHCAPAALCPRSHRGRTRATLLANVWLNRAPRAIARAPPPPPPEKKKKKKKSGAAEGGGGEAEPSAALTLELLASDTRGDVERRRLRAGDAVDEPALELEFSQTMPREHVVRVPLPRGTSGGDGESSTLEVSYMRGAERAQIGPGPGGDETAKRRKRTHHAYE